MKTAKNILSLLLAVWFVFGSFGILQSAAAESREHIDAVSLSCALEIQTGVPPQDVPVVTLAGTPAYPAFVYWQKKFGTVWHNMILQTMTPGTYRLFVQIRCDQTIDGADGKDYYVDADTKVTLNGESAEVVGSKAELSYSYIEIHSREITVERTISSLAVTNVPELIVGKSLLRDGITVSEGFRIESAEFEFLQGGAWTQASGRPVKENTAYRLVMTMRKYSEYAYTPQIETTVNGRSEDADGNPVAFTESEGVCALIYNMGVTPKEEPPAGPAVSIRGYVSERTERYFTTVEFTTDTQNVPIYAEVVWFVNGSQAQTGTETFAYYGAKQDYTVQVKIIRGGSVLAQSEVETVHIRHGFFDILFSLFRVLLGRPYSVKQ